MADIRAQALAYLRDGAVIVGTAKVGLLADSPYYVSARVQGHEDLYHVTLRPAGWPSTGVDGSTWRCTCPQTHPNGDGCAHIASVQLVTGWPSAAAKPAKEGT